MVTGIILQAGNLTKDEQIQQLQRELFQVREAQLREELRIKDEELQIKDEELQNKDYELQKKDEELQKKDAVISWQREELMKANKVSNRENCTGHYCMK